MAPCNRISRKRGCNIIIYPIYPKLYPIQHLSILL